MNEDEYQSWLQHLRKGSRVIIRRPWFDRHENGGGSEMAFVERRKRSTMFDHIHVNGIVFNGRTGLANFNAKLESPK